MELLGLRTVWNCFVYGHFFLSLLYWNCSVYVQSVVWLLWLWTECGTCLFVVVVWVFCFVFVLFLTLWSCSNRGEKEWICSVYGQGMKLSSPCEQHGPALWAKCTVCGAALSVGTGMHTLSLLFLQRDPRHCPPHTISLFQDVYSKTWTVDGGRTGGIEVDVCVCGGKKTNTSHTLNYKILSCLLLTPRNQ